MSTNKQNNVLSYIKTHKEQYGEYPTLKEIGRNVGVRSVSTIHQHMNKLIEQGLLQKSSDYSGYTVVDETPTVNRVPIIGTITAGYPIDAIEETDQDFVTVSELPRHGEFYALRVVGDSMIDEGIFDGDTVVIKRQTSAQNGQTVVAIIDDNQATLKKIYREDNGYRLQPANQKMLPLFREEVEVRGVIWEIKRNLNRNNEDEKYMATKKWKTLDLFAGIGGIRIGFENAGFKTVFANDFDSKCKLTYDENFIDSKLVVEDITKINVRDLPEFDFLLGGFPCQAFSIAGYRHGFDDKKGRGNLFFDIARILDERRPEGFLLENVKNLRSHDGGNTFKVILKTLEGLGYHVKYKILNSMEYGNVPQNRERIYIVGFNDKKKTEAFEFPEPIPLTNNIASLLEKDVDKKYYYNGKPLYERLVDEVNEKNQVYQWRRQYVRKNKKGVCPTLTANMGMGGHNVPIIYDGKGIRKLTPKECLLIQGFPKDFILPEIADSALYKQIGNSVSVPVVQRVAEAMVKVL